MTELSLQRLNDAAVLPHRVRPGDAGLDLYSVEPAVLRPGDRVLVGTGWAVELPQDHAALIVPRSGLALESGITVLNAPGTVDQGYRGEVKVLLINLGDATVELPIGTRIAQLLLVPITTITPRVVTALRESERGDLGFGSTGP